MSRSLLSFALGLGVGLSLALVWLAGGERPTAVSQTGPAQARRAEYARAGGVARAVDHAGLLADVRAAVRDELSAQPCEHGADRSPSTEADVEPLPTPSDDELRALAQAEQLIDAARAGSPWTDDTASAFRQQILQVDAALSEELVKSLFVAINTGQIEVATTGAPI